jgi:hypothetical protein
MLSQSERDMQILKQTLIQSMVRVKRRANKFLNFNQIFELLTSSGPRI